MDRADALRGRRELRVVIRQSLDLATCLAVLTALLEGKTP
jgi:hypothetical protein